MLICVSVERIHAHLRVFISVCMCVCVCVICMFIQAWLYGELDGAEAPRLMLSCSSFLTPNKELAPTISWLTCSISLININYLHFFSCNHKHNRPIAKISQFFNHCKSLANKFYFRC